MAEVAKTDQPPVTIPPATPAKTDVQPKEAVVPSDCTAVNVYDWNTRIAYAICMAESRGIASKDNAGLNANGTVDYGLMQINSIHADMVGGDLTKLLDPATNIRVAYSLSRGGTDWTPWTTYTSGKYLAFLN